MPSRVLAALSVAVVVAACSTAAQSPTWTYAPTAPEVAATTPTLAPSIEPATAPSVIPSVEPAAEPLSGEVNVVMLDTMRYAPDSIAVKAGEEITFTVKNDGVAVHEFFVGTEEEQADHAAEMAAGGMSHGHDNALSLEGGESGSLTMTFPEATVLLIGCHEPGHYEAGMKGSLEVVD